MTTGKKILEHLADQQQADRLRYAELVKQTEPLTQDELQELAGLTTRLGVTTTELQADLAAVEAAKGLGLLRQKLAELTSARRLATVAVAEHDQARVLFMEKWSLEFKELAEKMYGSDVAIVAVEGEIAVAEKAVAAGAVALGFGGLLDRPEPEPEPTPDTVRVWAYPPAVPKALEVELYRVEVDDLAEGDTYMLETGGPDSGWWVVDELRTDAVRVSYNGVTRFIQRANIRVAWKLPAVAVSVSGEVDLRE